MVLAALLFLLSAIAFASGGILSPLVFSATGVLTLVWPRVAATLPLAELIPVGESILLRSRYFPFRWCAIAELKPGLEPFPMAAASFSGTLIAFTDTGRTYCAVSCLASGRRDAEDRLLSGLRSVVPKGRPGAYILPLDSLAAAGVLKIRLSPLKLPVSDLPKFIASMSGLVLLECRGGTVRRASAFGIDGPAKVAALPRTLKELEVAPLAWEVFDSIGKRTRWPDPDRYSELLDSLLATKAVPFVERLRGLEAAGDELKVSSLGGDEISATRPQLRAIVSIYS
jgi:hypothetical protein